MTAVTLSFGYSNMGSGPNNPTPGAVLHRVLSGYDQGLRPHLGVFVEAYDFIPLINRLSHSKGYRDFHAPRPETKGELRGAWDNVILRRRTLPNLGQNVVRAHGPSKPLKWAPSRYFITQCTEVRGKRVAVIAVHPNAVLAGLDAREVDRVRKTSEFWKDVNREIKRLKGMGFAVFVIGDFNLGRKQSYSHGVTPWQVLGWHHMGVETTGVDAFAFPRRFDVTKFEVIEGFKDRTGHNGIAVKGKL